MTITGLIGDFLLIALPKSHAPLLDLLFLRTLVLRFKKYDESVRGLTFEILTTHLALPSLRSLTFLDVYTDWKGNLWGDLPEAVRRTSSTSFVPQNCEISIEILEQLFLWPKSLLHVSLLNLHLFYQNSRHGNEDHFQRLGDHIDSDITRCVLWPHRESLKSLEYDSRFNIGVKGKRLDLEKFPALTTISRELYGMWHHHSPELPCARAASFTKGPSNLSSHSKNL